MALVWFAKSVSFSINKINALPVLYTSINALSALMLSPASNAVLAIILQMDSSSVHLVLQTAIFVSTTSIARFVSQDTTSHLENVRHAVQIAYNATEHQQTARNVTSDRTPSTAIALCVELLCHFACLASRMEAQ